MVQSDVGMSRCGDLLDNIPQFIKHSCIEYLDTHLTSKI